MENHMYKLYTRQGEYEHFTDIDTMDGLLQRCTNQSVMGPVWLRVFTLDGTEARIPWYTVTCVEQP